MQSTRPLSIVLWASIYGAVLIWSLIAPKDGLTWVLEATPALIAALLLAVTYRQFQFTPLAYQLILVHCLVLFVGAHYTYAEVPLFTELQHWLGTARNDYDKLGHFAQGMVPAVVAREIVIRFKVIRGEAWRGFFILCFVLAVSATYELIEWAAALLSEEAAEAFLGTQGYEWDTQSDMFWALSGAVFALLFLTRLHNRQLAALSPSS